MHVKESYPTLEECRELMTRFEMLPNIVAHSEQVMRVSDAIYSHLTDKSAVDRGLLLSACLLHDIAKTRTLRTRELRHDLIGGEMLRELDYPRVAFIVESHVVFEDFMPDGALEEREIVFYADKRVMHDAIVSVEDRVRDLVQRYGVNPRIAALIEDNKEFVYRIERKISRFLDGDINAILRALC